MKIGNKEFDTINHTYIMGILNVTPDSFSDGGSYDKPDQALKRAEKMVDEGADIIDVGGESTRPGYIQISIQEEIERVVPIIEKIKNNIEVPISVDTYKSEVAKAAIQAGADLVNDIWGLKYDPQMASLIAEHEAACCLMHNREHTEYVEFMTEVLRDLKESVQIAESAGIDKTKIILDPGIGFGKNYEMNLQILKDLEEFHQLGYPMLLAASRKSVIGLTLDLPVEQRTEGTLVTTVMAVMKHYSFVRVHDIRENKRVILMTEAILKGAKRWTK